MKRFLSVVIFACSALGMWAQDLYHARMDGNVDSVYLGLDSVGPYTGESVIIGVTDWGFDYSHPVFYDTLMSDYRILRAWDQFRNGGPAPAGFNYGTELVGREQLLAAACDTSNIYGHHYHGTHVASIAGGSGAGTDYRGVAPGANFIFCSFRPDEQSVIDAFQWMYEVAQQEQKRLVINMSWGLYWMDNPCGTGPVGQKMQELSDLGVVFVTSGGNNGDELFHLGHTFQNDTLRSRIMFPSANGSDAFWGTSITMTNSSGQPFSAGFYATDNHYQTICASPLYSTQDGDRYEEGFITDGTDTVFYNIQLMQNDHSGRPDARLRIKKNPSTNSWRLVLNVVGEQGEFHAWNVAELTTGVGNWGGKFMGLNGLGWKAGDCHYGIGTPASVDCAITVAAHVSAIATDSTSTGGGICSFSSYGPTVDGRDKPDISAPGSEICAAVNSYADAHFSLISPIEYEGRTYGFSRLSGTSMSSPFVTGVVALLLEANPTLTPQQVKEVLIYSATHDEFTESAGMVRFGHGKVNARQAILRALNNVGIQQYESSVNQYTCYPNPVEDKLLISTPNSTGKAQVSVFDISGRLLCENTLNQGVNVVDFSTLPVGCYVVRIVCGSYVQSEKIIKSK